MKVSIRTIGERCGLTERLWSGQYKRIFVMSDIHGDDIHFFRAKEELEFGSEDLVIIAGDFVDRCKPNSNLLKLCSEIRFDENRDYEVLVLRGNHEEWMANAINMYINNGLGDKKVDAIVDFAKYLSIEELKGYSEWLGGLEIATELCVEKIDRKIKIAHASTIDYSSKNETIMGESSTFFYEWCQTVDCKDINIVGHIPTNTLRYLLYVPNNKGGTDILHLNNDALIAIDCGNGYRSSKINGKLGILEITQEGTQEYYF